MLTVSVNTRNLRQNVQYSGDNTCQNLWAFHFSFGLWHISPKGSLYQWYGRGLHIICCQLVTRTELQTINLSQTELEHCVRKMPLPTSAIRHKICLQDPQTKPKTSSNTRHKNYSSSIHVWMVQVCWSVVYTDSTFCAIPWTRYGTECRVRKH